ncbi:flagellar hook-basal body complex protein FliE [Bradyrhizobium sp. Tv2a-2]|uniref:flagellar hook-basal body complex protein FliE n=1 Tax=Bradyrhizobium sp. Tv2a-2 TaxID=113395 RepID=UPI0004006BBC|nr:flagellar hook-basal body complex protein FliE [Bradyrhizobium sp. Tv2a-2]
MASPTVAANAYANLARVLESGGASKGNANLGRIMETGGASAGADGNGPSFSTVLKDAIGSVLEAGRKSDAQTVAMANGKANVMDVVTAVAETDVAVSTLVSVRDKVIQAYEDIMKMTI